MADLGRYGGGERSAISERSGLLDSMDFCKSLDTFVELIRGASGDVVCKYGFVENGGLRRWRNSNVRMVIAATWSSDLMSAKSTFHIVF